MNTNIWIICFILYCFDLHFIKSLFKKTNVAQCRLLDIFYSVYVSELCTCSMKESRFITLRFVWFFFLSFVLISWKPLQVAYDLEDYYHSVQWFEEAVRLFRGTEWSPENEGTFENALDHLAFSHFKVQYLWENSFIYLQYLHFEILWRTYNY